MEEYPLKSALKPAATTVFALLFLLLLASCSQPNATLAVLRGNFLFRGGEDALAAHKYLQVLEQERLGKWEDWLTYDLGSLYVSLGEVNPGLRVLYGTLEGFSDLPRELNRWDRELFYRTFFNAGVAHYEMGSFEEAAASFVQALRLEPDSLDAKINLELSINASLKAAGSRRRAAVKQAPETRQKNDQETSDTVFEKIHKEERPAWASAPSPEDFGRDW